MNRVNPQFASNRHSGRIAFNVQQQDPCVGSGGEIATYFFPEISIL
jgi:hypothetical protein